MQLFEDTYELTDAGIKIQEEFENIIKPFFKKYGAITNPIELEWIVNQAIGMKNCSNYVNRVTEEKVKN